jgi:hypothetical protein
MSDANDMIGVVPKNSREEVRISIAEYRGTRFIDVRVYADTGAVDRRPTKAGVTIRPDRLAQLIEALRLAEREAVRRGLIGD